MSVVVAPPCPLGNPKVCECRQYGKDPKHCRFAEGAPMSKRAPGSTLNQLVEAAMKAKGGTACEPS